MDLTDSKKIDWHIAEQPFEVVNGDAAFIDTDAEQIFIGIVDGAGHGPAAHEIAQFSQNFLISDQDTELPILMTRLHNALRGTRGGVAATGRIDVERLKFHYVAVGNLQVKIFGNKSHRAVTQPGVLGTAIRTPVEKEIQITPGDVLILHTDGIGSHFDYPELLEHDARTIAENLVSEFSLHNDDATCIVVKFQ